MADILLTTFKCITLKAICVQCGGYFDDENPLLTPTHRKKSTLNMLAQQQHINFLYIINIIQHGDNMHI